MEAQQPETFSEYFKLKVKRIKEWVIPNPEDPIMITILKTFLKSLAVLLLLLFSPVLILGLTIAFFATF